MKQILRVAFICSIVYVATGCTSTLSTYRHHLSYDGKTLHPRPNEVALLVGGMMLPSWEANYGVVSGGGGFAKINEKSFLALQDSIELLPGKHQFKYYIPAYRNNHGLWAIEIETTDWISVDVEANSVYAVDCRLNSFSGGRATASFKVIRLPLNFEDLERIEGASIDQAGWKTKAERLTP